MLVLNNVKCRKVHTENLPLKVRTQSQAVSLVQENVENNQNNIQLKKVFDAYDLYRFLK